VSLPRARLLDTSAAFSDSLIEIGATVTHSHGPGGAHMHSGYAAVTWLDPLQAVTQAAAIRDALIRARPDANEALKQNFQSLEKELLELDSKLKDVAGKLPSVPILASHPVYQYLERRYALDVRTIYWEADRYPAPVAWEVLAGLAGKVQPALMLWETAPLPATQQQLEKHGIRSVVFETAANRSDQGDYLSVMQENISRLQAAVR
jgi:zinc transport system substrate-binding protein